MLEIKLYVALIIIFNPVNTDEVQYALNYSDTQTECVETLAAGVTALSESFKGYRVQGQCVEYTF